MSSKIFNLAPRKPNAVSEEAARRLEAAIEAKGEGVAGQAVAAAVVPQARELTSSVEVPVAPTPVLVPAEAKPIEPTIAETPPPAQAASEAPVAPPARNTTSSRARSTTESQARELPLTGTGTFHNPYVRKADGVKTRSTTVHLPMELAQKLAVHCAMTGRRQSEVITEAVEAILR